MAVKASASVTLTSVVDVASTTRYYLLQSSTLAKPSKPASKPPGGSWNDTEPTYTAGSTNSLYFVDLTVFSDGTWSYSSVSLSSSYEAAKAAYNTAQGAYTAAGEAQIGAEAAQSTAESAAALAAEANDILAPINTWFTFAADGMKIGKEGSQYTTLTDDTGFHILQNGAKISSFAKRQLSAERVRIGEIGTTATRLVIRVASDGGIAITGEED